MQPSNITLQAHKGWYDRRIQDYNGKIMHQQHSKLLELILQLLEVINLD